MNNTEAKEIFDYLIKELNQEVAPTCKEIGMDRSYYYKIMKGDNISTQMLTKCRKYAELKDYSKSQ